MSLLPPLISFIHHFLKKKIYIFQRKTFQQYLKWHADSEPHCHCHDTPQYTFKQESTHGHHFALESGCKEEKPIIILYANRCKREDRQHITMTSSLEVNKKFSNFSKSKFTIYKKQKQADIIYRTNLNGVCILMAELIADVLPLVVLFGSRWQSCWREFFYIATRGKRQHPDPFLSFPQVTLYQSASQASCLPLTVGSGESEWPSQRLASRVQTKDMTHQPFLTAFQLQLFYSVSVLWSSTNPVDIIIAF